MPCWGRCGWRECPAYARVWQMPDCSRGPSATACPGLPGPGMGWSLSPAVSRSTAGDSPRMLYVEEEEDKRHLRLLLRAKPGCSARSGWHRKPMALWAYGPPLGGKAPHGPRSALQNTHLEYILAAAHLFAQAYKVPPCHDRAAVQTILRAMVLPPFSPQEGLQIPLAEEQEEAQGPAGEAPHPPGSPRACPQALPGGAALQLIPAPAPTRTQTRTGGHRAVSPAVPQCTGTTLRVPVLQTAGGWQSSPRTWCDRDRS